MTEAEELKNRIRKLETDVLTIKAWLFGAVVGRVITTLIFAL